MLSLIKWQILISLILLGVFIPVFTLLGGWDKIGDPRFGAGVLAFIPVVAVAYTINSASNYRLLSLIAGFSAMCFGLFAFLDGWVAALMLAAMAFVAFLAYDDFRKETSFEREDTPLPAFWTALSLLIQFAVLLLTVAGIVYNLPNLLLAWVAVPIALVIGLLAFLYRWITRRNMENGN